MAAKNRPKLTGKKVRSSARKAKKPKKDGALAKRQEAKAVKQLKTELRRSGKLQAQLLDLLGKIADITLGRSSMTEIPAGTVPNGHGGFLHHDEQQQQANELLQIVAMAETAVAEMQEERRQLDASRRALEQAKSDAEKAILQLQDEKAKRETASLANHSVLTEAHRKLKEELQKLISLARKS